MKTSISVVCYKWKGLANGESPLMLRVAKDGRRTLKSLGISINSTYWDFDRNEPKSNCPNKELINKIILKTRLELLILPLVVWMILLLAQVIERFTRNEKKSPSR